MTLSGQIYLLEVLAFVGVAFALVVLYFLVEFFEGDDL